MPFDFTIIESGSNPGNCTVLDKHIMIDCGLSIKRVKQTIDLTDIKIAIVTHRHTDHVKYPLIKALAKQGTFLYLPQAVVDTFKKTYPKEPLSETQYRTLESVSRQRVAVDDVHTITFIPQEHEDLINYAIYVEKEDKIFLYATDLDTLFPSDVGDGIMHLNNIDVLALEGNYDETYIRRTIIETLTQYDNSRDWSECSPEEIAEFLDTFGKMLPKGTYRLLYRAIQNLRHLSKQQARSYAANHMKKDGRYYEMHRSREFYEEPTTTTIENLTE